LPKPFRFFPCEAFLGRTGKGLGIFCQAGFCRRSILRGMILIFFASPDEALRSR
jgi:hypothetical protein